jgi:hypothetical protein
MAYRRIFWKDRIVVTNENGVVDRVIQEGTPLSAYNLNLMDEGIFKVDAFMEMIRKNQLEILTSRDLDNLRVSMDEGYWFDTLKNENKIKSKSNANISNNLLSLSGETGEVEFKVHEIGFKANKTTYYHKRKASQSQFLSANNKDKGNKEVEIEATYYKLVY